MIMTWVYRVIVLLIFAFTAKEFWEEKRPSAKICACMVLVPLALRMLMIK